MKILEIIPQLDSGGGERFTVDLCNELARKHTVKLIVLFPFENHNFYISDISNRIEVISMNKKLGVDVLLPFRIMREVIKFKPDVVHTHLRAITYECLSALLLRRIVHCHTVHSAADKEAGSFICRIVRKLMFKCGFMTPITISEESYQSFVKFYGLDAPMIFNGRNVPETITPAENAVNDIQQWRNSPHTRIIINLARVMRVKRQGLIARVCRRLSDDGYDFKMIFMGRNVDKVVMAEIAAADCPNALWVGTRTNPLDYLSLADAYCLLSEYEGMPISLIEALGSGAVPVCTPVGGIVDVIRDGENGFITDDLSEEACYRALKRFLDLSDSELVEMKEQAHKSYEPFSMTGCAEKYLLLFERISQNKSGN